MAEYVERDFVLNGIDTVIVAAKGIAGDDPISNKTVSIIKNIRAFINSVPAADVAPVVHGRWVAKPTMYRHPNARNYYCAECRYEPTETKEFCPLCGARMDGE